LPHIAPAFQQSQGYIAAMKGTGEMPSVAIVGRPNVGKSALFNRLIGRKTAIVHDQPGITRDRLWAVCRRGEHPFALWDTGGVGGAGERELTRQVQRAVDEAIRASDLLLFVVDGQQGLSPLDQALARRLRKSRKPLILVVNKIDDPKHEFFAVEFTSLGFEPVISVSAEHGRGFAELIETIQKQSATPQLSESRQLTPATAREIAIAIVGRPNVGKSSLINAITQSDRAIVSELPGTTRDAIDISYQRNSDHYLFIDTAGMRKRGRQSTSVEVFSVMRSERTIRRADLCVLIVDATTGATAQDKKISGLIQEASKAAIIVVNKLDLVQSERGSRHLIDQIVTDTRQRLFFLEYAPVLVTSATKGEHVDKVFRLIKRIERAAQKRIGTGVLNRLLRSAFAANPPPMKSGRRLKLFYATQARGAGSDRSLPPPEFVLFVNDPRLLTETYRRYLEARMRQAEPYPGLPIRLTCRPRSEKGLHSRGFDRARA
jgi:GTP-binding protein